MTISVIANFYKSERYIPKLIQSVLAQSYSDWELLCVNDCSPGNDLAVIEKFAKKDSRIRIINNETNLGICKAKYRGIEEAKGEYLCFIDGDDWLEPDALKKMIEPAIEHDLDMVVMNHKKVLPIIGYARLHCTQAPVDTVIEINPHATEEDDARKNFVRYYSNFFGNSVFMVTYCCKLIKKSVITESGFTPPSSYIAEDFVFSMPIFPYLRKIMFIDYAGYNWRWGGITSGKKNNIWTGEMNIRRSNEIYMDRLQLIEKYSLNCFEQGLMIEQRNNFEGFIGNEAKEDAETEYGKSVIKVLNEVLQAGFYSDFLKLKEGNDKYADDELLDSIIERDAKRVYKYCRKVYKTNQMKRVVKNAIHTVLYPLAKV